MATTTTTPAAPRIWVPHHVPLRPCVVCGDDTRGRRDDRAAGDVCDCPDCDCDVDDCTADGGCPCLGDCCDDAGVR